MEIAYCVRVESRYIMWMILEATKTLVKIKTQCSDENLCELCYCSVDSPIQCRVHITSCSSDCLHAEIIKIQKLPRNMAILPCKRKFCVMKE